MKQRLVVRCQMSERNNGIVRALFVCTQKSQEETLLLNWVLDRGEPETGAKYKITVEKAPEYENGH